MKGLMIAMLALAIPSVFGAPTPVCDKVGTESEGWYLNGELMKDYRGFEALGKCAGKAAECSGVGTRSEGWQTFSKIEGRLLAWGRCSASEIKPECRGVGTESEGWYLSEEPLETIIGRTALENCSEKHVECGFYAGSMEGWFVYKKADSKLLAWAKCSE